MSPGEERSLGRAALRVAWASRALTAAAHDLQSAGATAAADVIAEEADRVQGPSKRSRRSTQKEGVRRSDGTRSLIHSTRHWRNLVERLESTYARFVKGAPKLVQAQLRSSCPAYKARRSGPPLEHPAAAPLVPRPPVHARAGRHSLNRIGGSVHSALSAAPAANLRIATQNAPYRPGTLGPDDAGSGRTSSTIFNRHRGGQPRAAGVILRSADVGCTLAPHNQVPPRRVNVRGRGTERSDSRRARNPSRASVVPSSSERLSEPPMHRRTRCD
jgi:hypothetical protein